jgi:DNA-binding NarL/FixJ family response regulator
MPKKTSNIKIAVVDDNHLLRSGLTMMLLDFGFNFYYGYGSGMELKYALSVSSLPVVVLIDIDLSNEDAYNTIVWLQEHYPSIKIVAMGIDVDESTITRIIHCGAKDYIMKDLDPWHLKNRLKDLMK